MEQGSVLGQGKSSLCQDSVVRHPAVRGFETQGLDLTTPPPVSPPPPPPPPQLSNPPIPHRKLHNLNTPE